MTSNRVEHGGAAHTSSRKALDHFVLEIADDALVLGHRLSEWCGHGPTIEEDIALSNISLDHLGQAQCLYELLVENDANYGSADKLAFFRDSFEFRNCILVEQENGDFAQTIVRQVYFSAYYYFLYEQLSSCPISLLSDFAAKARKEVSYHLRHAGEWILRLGDGTTESKARAQAAIVQLWPFVEELLAPSEAASILIAESQVFEPSTVSSAYKQYLETLLSEATLEVPSSTAASPLNGRQLKHSEHLSQLLSVMQSTARAHPDALW